MLTVAATARSQITSYANFSATEVQVAAPGGDEFTPIFSLTTLNVAKADYVGMAGTSMATPATCGVAALVWAMDLSQTPLQVKNILMQSGKPETSLQGKTVTGEQIDAKQAVQKFLDLKPALAIN